MLVEIGPINHAQVPVEDLSLIRQALPLEIFSLILSHLRVIDLPSTAKVSHYWYKITGLTISEPSSLKHFSWIKNYAEFLNGKLKERAGTSLINELADIAEQMTLLDCVIPARIELSIYELREKILNGLIKLQILNSRSFWDMASSCKDRSKPKYFENILQVGIV